MRRIIPTLLLCAALAPGLWLRDPPQAVATDERITATLLPIDADAVRLPGMRLLGVWQMGSRNSFFYGFSALLWRPPGQLMAFSDAGYVVRFGDPHASISPTFIGKVGQLSGEAKANRDIEAATRNPDTGQIWIALERSNSISRTNDSLTDWSTVRPRAMRGWPNNEGPEALTRLRDGRFLVLSETRSGSDAWETPGLLFPDDPLKKVRPIGFRFAPPDGFRPVDAATLPDGRVLILLRKLELSLPPGFRSQLVLADPADIRAGQLWPWNPVGRIDHPLPRDNYEALAVTPEADGSVVVWLMSDDNQSVFQRTLLVKLRWQVPPR
ncbi:esterase-like activity of phytase family protein [Altericroceibacterium xinjiangense]|uniref:esterase-like activity of phytase family protein n=1 Tax=Altericroceibacterium xinjiangense TaxID=762261 RepID=UPI000F7D77EA|nr:esterase-like activity of phytase family protein [Altericroceibacterium xinjiangense]